MYRFFYKLTILVFCLYATVPVIAGGTRDKSRLNEAITQDEHSFGQEEYGQEIDGYIHIIGIGKDNYREARNVAIDNLVLQLGLVEVFSRYTKEVYRITNDFESLKEKNSITSTKGEASTFSRITSRTLLPPLGKIHYMRDKDYYYCHVYVRNDDKEKIRTIIEITNFFQPDDAGNDESMYALYVRKVLEINTMLTSQQAISLAQRLEGEFFVATRVIDNTVYVCPRDRYETKIIDFLNRHFSRVAKNGNKASIYEPDFKALEQDGLSLRLMRVNTNIPLPELNYVLRQNGLDMAEKSSRERFECNISFKENQRTYGFNINVDVGIIDKRDNRVLLSETLVSPNYSRINTSQQVMAVMKKELVALMEKALPYILINY